MPQIYTHLLTTIHKTCVRLGSTHKPQHRNHTLSLFKNKTKTKNVNKTVGATYRESLGHAVGQSQQSGTSLAATAFSSTLGVSCAAQWSLRFRLVLRKVKVDSDYCAESRYDSVASFSGPGQSARATFSPAERFC